MQKNCYFFCSQVHLLNKYKQSIHITSKEVHKGVED